MVDYMYHLCPVESWQACKDQNNPPYFPPTYEQDGFIHLTADPALLLQVANHFYKQDPGKWIVLCIDSGRLTSEVTPHPSAPPLPFIYLLYCIIVIFSTLSLVQVFFFRKKTYITIFDILFLLHFLLQVKFEPAAPVGTRPSHGLTSEESNEPLFPHLYGSIDFAALVDELPVERDANGTFLTIQNLEKYSQ